MLRNLTGIFQNVPIIIWMHGCNTAIIEYIIFVYEKIDEAVVKASRNIQRVKVMDYRNLNTYEVLACDKLVFVGKSLDNLVEFLG